MRTPRAALQATHATQQAALAAQLDGYAGPPGSTDLLVPLLHLDVERVKHTAVMIGDLGADHLRGAQAGRHGMHTNPVAQAGYKT